MGLDTTHGCWHGGYGSFSVFREALARAAEWPADGPDEGFEASGGSRINWSALPDGWLMGEGWESVPEDPLIILQAHSDCDGILPVFALVPLADRLEELRPKVHDAALAWAPAWADELPERVDQFVRGLRAAAAAGEPVEFG
jgi:hypothetical protein